MTDTLAELADRIEVQKALDLSYSRKSVHYYLDRVRIMSAPEPRPFGSVADDWQRQVVAPKANAIDGLAGLAPYTGPRSFLTILPRGHDKSSLESRLLNWALVFSKRPIDACLCAADLDQAKLIIQAMADEAKLNPHLLGDLKFSKYEVSGPGGRVTAMPADAGSAYGGRYNLIIADEITHWKNGLLWDAIVSGRHKVPDSILVVISNAGFLGSWQHNVRQEAVRDPGRWKHFEKVGSLASWLDPDDIAASRRLLPDGVARRVLDNHWLDPAEESGYLNRGDIDLCVDPNWVGLAANDYRSGHRFVLVVDYGARKDRTALGVLHCDAAGVVWVDRLDVWQGTPDSPVQVTAVDEWLDARISEYDPASVVLDEYQMEGSIQRQVRQGQEHRIRRFEYRGGRNNFEMAQDLRAAVIERRVRWGPRHGRLGDSTVADELAALVTRFMSYGYRFDHKAKHHDDRAVVLGMGVMEAQKHRPTPQLESPYTPPTNRGNISMNPLISRG